MKTFIVINLAVEGFHNWPEAREVFPEVGFLSDRHRHMFTIKAVKAVTHTDRDVEIIMFKREMEAYIESKYGRPAEFGRCSCEDLCQELLTQFDLAEVEVLEDGENGARVQL